MFRNLLKRALNLNIELSIPERCLSSKSESNEFGNLVCMIANMPKEPKAAKELRIQRMKAKAKGAQQARPAEITLWVLGNGALGNPKSLYVSSDQSRYLFNCGEGTQRLAHEHKMKLSKLEHIFFTHSNWSNIGGLPGLALTIQDIGVPEICIHGPRNIEKLFEMTKGFMVMENLKLAKRNPADRAFVDNCMRVEYVSLFPREATNAKRLKRDEDVAIVVAYICKLHSKPGQLQLDRCVQMGVPPGPLLGELKNGKDVTLPNGNIVKSSDVVSAEEPGPVFIVLEVPSVDYLDCLLEAREFERHQLSAAAPEDAAKVVVHFTPSAIMEDPLYVQWIRRFPASTVHLALNEYSSPESSVAIHRAQHRLHLLNCNIFPLLKSEVQRQPPKTLSELNVCPGETLAKFRLRPCHGLERDSAIKIDADAYIREAHSSPHFEERLSELKAATRALDSTKTVPSYPEVVFLGTASAIPGKERNVSSILVNVNVHSREDSSVLLDCGEGTSKQMIRFYGSQEFHRVLSRLSCVFVSHMHADHHLGLLQLLKERQLSLQLLDLPWHPLTVIAPRFLVPWISRYHSVFEPVSHLFSYVDNASLLWDRAEVSNEQRALFTRWGLQSLSTVLVKHCKHAYGITLTTQGGWKVTYSADTMPCDTLIQAGEGSDLLIHEATMEDDLADEAAIKITTSEAIDAGRRMGAKFTLLTHFSQRYAKLPLISESFHSTVGCAFDHMKVSPQDLPALPLLFPALKSIFAEHYQEMREKTAKKLRQKSIIEEKMRAT
ncbi:ribonuclease Z, mitochondrial-like isoform X2 [Ornithodoros turicata]|uniref:ribonuclease Z, mitochondrial-like isoform X2 n=1 Tax=Ornithodoros turicata TaxID=34597 RepID=UPI0031390D48